MEFNYRGGKIMQAIFNGWTWESTWVGRVDRVKGFREYDISWFNPEDDQAKPCVFDIPVKFRDVFMARDWDHRLYFRVGVAKLERISLNALEETVKARFQEAEKPAAPKMSFRERMLAKREEIKNTQARISYQEGELVVSGFRADLGVYFATILAVNENGRMTRKYHHPKNGEIRLFPSAGEIFVFRDQFNRSRYWTISSGDLVELSLGEVAFNLGISYPWGA